MGLRLALLTAVALALAACGQAAPDAVANAPVAENAIAVAPPAGRVIDRANLLSPAEETYLSEASAALERDTGAQFAIATVPDLHGQTIEEYSLQLARAWHLGSRERNDGVLLLVAVAERKVRIEVGRGLERRIIDPFASRVIRQQIAPHFREGNYPAGIIAGSEAIIVRLRSRATDREIAAEDNLLI